MATAKNPISLAQPSTRRDAQQLILGHASNELIFGVVGHVGSGNSKIATTLKSILEGTDGGGFECEIVHARELILDWAKQHEKSLPDLEDRSLSLVKQLQDLGDEMRSQRTASGAFDLPAVARALILKVRTIRATKLNQDASKLDPIIPDGTRRAYILDSLRHPAEVELLRQVYQEAFVLIGVVCEAKKRRERINQRYSDAGYQKAEQFMERDAEAKESYGQHVADAFHLADFFVDNTADRLLPNGESNRDWDINDKLARLVKIVTHEDIVRPDIAERAMHHANGAMMQSVCMSRQVGAALVDSAGNVVATGTNEVPKAGGGVYGQSFGRQQLDDRCALRGASGDRRFCSNTREQNKIIEQLISSVPELDQLSVARKGLLAVELRST